MSEISKFAWMFIGVLVVVASALINWKKFLLFIIAGVGFILYGLKKDKENIQRKRKNYNIQQRNYINQRNYMQRR